MAKRRMYPDVEKEMEQLTDDVEAKLEKAKNDDEKRAILAEGFSKIGLSIERSLNEYEEDLIERQGTFIPVLLKGIELSREFNVPLPVFPFKEVCSDPIVGMSILLSWSLANKHIE